MLARSLAHSHTHPLIYFEWVALSARAVSQEAQQKECDMSNVYTQREDEDMVSVNIHGEMEVMKTLYFHWSECRFFRIFSKLLRLEMSLSFPGKLFYSAAPAEKIDLPELAVNS